MSIMDWSFLKSAFQKDIKMEIPFLESYSEGPQRGNTMETIEIESDSDSETPTNREFNDAVSELSENSSCFDKSTVVCSPRSESANDAAEILILNNLDDLEAKDPFSFERCSGNDTRYGTDAGLIDFNNTSDINNSESKNGVENMIAKDKEITERNYCRNDNTFTENFLPTQNLPGTSLNSLFQHSIPPLSSRMTNLVYQTQYCRENASNNSNIWYNHITTTAITVKENLLPGPNLPIYFPGTPLPSSVPSWEPPSEIQNSRNNTSSNSDISENHTTLEKQMPISPVTPRNENTADNNKILSQKEMTMSGLLNKDINSNDTSANASSLPNEILSSQNSNFQRPITPSPPRRPSTEIQNSRENPPYNSSIPKNHATLEKPISSPSVMKISHKSEQKINLCGSLNDSLVKSNSLSNPNLPGTSQNLNFQHSGIPLPWKPSNETQNSRKNTPRDSNILENRTILERPVSRPSVIKISPRNKNTTNNNLFPSRKNTKKSGSLSKDIDINDCLAKNNSLLNPNLPGTSQDSNFQPPVIPLPWKMSENRTALERLMSSRSVKKISSRNKNTTNDNPISSQKKIKKCGSFSKDIDRNDNSVKNNALSNPNLPGKPSNEIQNSRENTSRNSNISENRTASTRLVLSGLSVTKISPLNANTTNNNPIPSNKKIKKSSSLSKDIDRNDTSAKTNSLPKPNLPGTSQNSNFHDPVSPVSLGKTSNQMQNSRENLLNNSRTWKNLTTVEIPSITEISPRNKNITNNMKIPTHKKINKFSSLSKDIDRNVSSVKKNSLSNANLPGTSQNSNFQHPVSPLSLRKPSNQTQNSGENTPNTTSNISTHKKINKSSLLSKDNHRNDSSVKNNSLPYPNLPGTSQNSNFHYPVSPLTLGKSSDQIQKSRENTPNISSILKNTVKRPSITERSPSRENTTNSKKIPIYKKVEKSSSLNKGIDRNGCIVKENSLPNQNLPSVSHNTPRNSNASNNRAILERQMSSPSVTKISPRDESTTNNNKVPSNKGKKRKSSEAEHSPPIQNLPGTSQNSVVHRPVVPTPSTVPNRIQNSGKNTSNNFKKSKSHTPSGFLVKQISSKNGKSVDNNQTLTKKGMKRKMSSEFDNGDVNSSTIQKVFNISNSVMAKMERCGAIISQSTGNKRASEEKEKIWTVRITEELGKSNQKNADSSEELADKTTISNPLKTENQKASAPPIKKKPTRNRQIKISKSKKQLQQKEFVELEKVLVGVKNSRHFRSMLDREEQSSLDRFARMEDNIKYVLMKLFVSKQMWFDALNFFTKAQIKVDDDKDILDIYKYLKEERFVDTDYRSSASLDELLDLLSLKDLNDIMKRLKEEPKICKTQNINTILEIARTSTDGFIMGLIEQKLGCLTFKLKREVFNSFYNAYLLATFTKPDLTNFNIPQAVFPKTPIELYPVFPSRNKFILYGQALKMQQELREKSKNETKKHYVLGIYGIGLKALHELKRNMHTDGDNHSKFPPHLERFTARYVYSEVLSTCCELLYYKQDCYPEDVKKWLEELIGGFPKSEKFGKWYYMLIRLHMYGSGNYVKAARQLIKILQRDQENPFLNEIVKYDLGLLARRLSRSRKHEIDQMSRGSLLKLIPRLIDLRKYTQQRTDSPYIRTDQCAKEVVLDHYKKIGFPKGEQRSFDSQIKALLVLFFWDIIYNPTTTVEGTFLSEYQSAPLDMFTSYFYKNRKDLIDKRLRDIDSEWSEEELILCVARNWEQHAHEEAAFGMVMDTINDMTLKVLVTIIGRKILAAIFKRLIQNIEEFSKGMPDLLLWNEEKTAFKLVKVGYDDKLSTEEKCWLQYLEQIKAPIEICWVYYSGSKSKKVKKCCDAVNQQDTSAGPSSRPDD